MPPTMILIGVCACAGAADRSEAEIAAKTAAARILRMGRFLVAAFSCGAGVKCFAGPRVPRGGGFGLFGGHEAPGAIPCQSDIWGVGPPSAGSNRPSGPGQTCDATADEGAARAEDARGRSETEKTRTSAKPILPDPHRNFIRNQRRVERIMFCIAQHKLERVLSGWKFDTRLGLARAKMKMRLVL